MIDPQAGRWYIFNRETRECVCTMRGAIPWEKELDDQGLFAVQGDDGLGEPGELMFAHGIIFRKVLL